MNRNVESHFSKLPAVNIQRSILDRGSKYSTTFNAGQLIPFYVDEVLPGDTFDVSTAKVVRMQTLLTPLMDNMYLDTYYFFVPNRLVWDKWKEFCGENTDSAWAPKTTHYIPKIASPAGGFEPGSIADFMGLPVGVEWKATDLLAPSALPFRAYALICDHFFRDENLTDPLLIPTDSANQQGAKITPRGQKPSPTGYIADTANGGDPFRVSRYHDYFSSALPAPQKGNPVGIPINVPGFAGGTFPVLSGAVDYLKDITDAQYPLLFHYSSSPNVTPVDGKFVMSDSSYGFVRKDTADLGVSKLKEWPPVSNNTDKPLTLSNLAVTIPPAGDGSGTDVSFSVNEFRLAYVYQTYLETLARSGTRYSELLLGLFGVQSPDARLQDPEYLGGNRIPINVSELLRLSRTSWVMSVQNLLPLILIMISSRVSLNTVM